VLILHGPSGVGKESIIAGLQAATGIHRAMSTTDRAPREGERDGVDYHFVSSAEFLRRVAAGLFAECAKVYCDLKGLERSEIIEPLARGEDVIIRTDVQGAAHWRTATEGAMSVIILPLDPARPVAEHREVTRARIIGRDGDVPADILAKRLAEIDAELADIPNNNYFVVNREGDPMSAIQDLLAVIERERADPARPTPRLLI
jgi:guanylate kinase